MERTAFESGLRDQGYDEVVERGTEANALNPEHAHESRLVIHEAMTRITVEGAERSYRAGDKFTIRAGCRHSERSGPEGARHLPGRRYPAAR